MRIRRVNLLVAMVMLFTLPAPASGSKISPESLSLQQVVTLGLERNLSLKGSRADREAGSWGRRATLASFLPTGSFQSSVTRVDNRSLEQANQAQEGMQSLLTGLATIPVFPDVSGVELDPFLYRDTWRSGFTINQEFPLNLHLLAGYRMSRAGERLLKQQYLTRRSELVLELRRGYFNLLAARDLITVANEGRGSAENRLALARDREQLGMIDRAETLRWEVSLAEARSFSASADNLERISEMILNRLLNHDLNTPLALQPAPAGAIPEGRRLAGLTPAEIADLVRRRSPGAGVLRAAGDLSGAGKLLAASGLTPSLHFQLSYGWRDNDTAALDDYSTWSATALVQVPVLDLLGRTMEYKQAAAEKRKSDYELAEGLAGLQLAAGAAWREVDLSRENLRLHLAAEAQATESFQLMRDRYELGHISEFDLVDIRTVLTRTSAQAVRARYDHYIALAVLESLLGDGGGNTEPEEVEK